MTTVAAPTIPSVRDVRIRLRRVRRTHSDRSLGELLTDVYLIAFLVVLYGGSAVVTLRRHLAQPVGGPVGLATTRAWLIVALLVTITALAWRGLRTFGPLLTTPAVQTWCLSTPIDRATWLRTPLAVVLGGSAVVGAAIGVAATWLSLPTSAWWAGLVGAAFGVTVAGLSVVAQSRPTRSGARIRPSDAALVLGLVLVTAAVATRVTRITVGPPLVPSWAFALLGLVTAAGSVRYALRALGHVDRAALAGGAQLAGAAVTAVVMLDPALLSGLVEARRWRGAHRVHSAHWIRGGRLWVLFQADLRRQWRRRSGLLAWAALVLAPYAVGVFSPAAIGSTRIIAAYLAVERLSAGLRLVARSPSLRRQLGGTDSDLKLIHLVVPAIGLALWWSATVWAGALPDKQLVQGIVVVGIIGAVYRTATRPPMSYDTGSADTPFGPVPTTLLRRLLRGPDLVAILVLLDLIF